MGSIRTIFIDFLFIVLIIILLSVSYLSFSRINSLVNTSNLVNHNRRIELKLEQTLLYLTDAASAQREFLITKDTIFLNLYFGATGEIQSSIAQLDSLTSKNEQQKKNLSLIKEITKNKLLLENLLNSSVSDKSIQITPLVFQNKKTMDSLRQQVRYMESADEALLKNEIKERNQFVTVNPLISITIISITLLIATLSYFITTKNKFRLSYLNKQLKEKNIELEQRNTELSAFNYISSHHLQEPLRKIQLFSSRITDTEAGLSEKGIEYFSRINSAAARMQNQIRSLLAYTDTTLSEVVFVKTDLNEILKEVESALKEIITRKNAKIESEHLPALHVVPAQIHELFLHLISNALKYAKPDIPPQIKITVKKVSGNEIGETARRDHAFWKIDIKDNGMGFEQAYQHKIFELFQQLHGPGDYDGNGIGLAICKKIVQTHKGIIRATGEPSVGATFTVFLPDDSNKLVHFKSSHVTI